MEASSRIKRRNDRRPRFGHENGSKFQKFHKCPCHEQVRSPPVLARLYPGVQPLLGLILSLVGAPAEAADPDPSGPDEPGPGPDPDPDTADAMDAKLQCCELQSGKQNTGQCPVSRREFGHSPSVTDSGDVQATKADSFRVATVTQEPRIAAATDREQRQQRSPRVAAVPNGEQLDQRSLRITAATDREQLEQRIGVLTRETELQRSVRIAAATDREQLEQRSPRVAVTPNREQPQQRSLRITVTRDREQLERRIPEMNARPAVRYLVANDDHAFSKGKIDGHELRSLDTDGEGLMMRLETEKCRKKRKRQRCDDDKSHGGMDKVVMFQTKKNRVNSGEDHAAIAKRLGLCADHLRSPNDFEHNEEVGNCQGQDFWGQEGAERKERKERKERTERKRKGKKPVCYLDGRQCNPTVCGDESMDQLLEVQGRDADRCSTKWNVRTEYFTTKPPTNGVDGTGTSDSFCKGCCDDSSCFLSAAQQPLTGVASSAHGGSNSEKKEEPPFRSKSVTADVIAIERQTNCCCGCFVEKRSLPELAGLTFPGLVRPDDPLSYRDELLNLTYAASCEGSPRFSFDSSVLTRQQEWSLEEVNALYIEDEAGAMAPKGPC
ncbi:hypothetical protein CBR_g45718 [Chara braunii]|uniref:Uncharacterized protein n=1 Tax=Chara braunii TaxID=69332 RepID=A0A388K3Z0_CHABU|nr:hypothetical protein CBR_g45718 [Chara braunii]|eukprot:GBG64663.1 hypothetical protein CBR_g45718 [Chara braunii]